MFRQLGFIALLIACSQGCSSAAADTTDEMLVVWEQTWNQIVERALTGYLDRAASSSLSSLDESPQGEALEELASLLYASVSWEALGSTFAANMRSECGSDVLEGMAPYFVSGDPSSVESSIVESYAVCAQNAVQASVPAISDAIMSKSEQISQPHARYSIDYP